VSGNRAVEALKRPSNWVQFAQFGAVGGIGYAVNLGVYALLLSLAHVHYLVAAIGAFGVAVTNNYLINRYWTFRGERGDFGQQGVRFFVVSVLSLGVNLIILHLFVRAGWDKIGSQAIAIVVVTPLNFIGNKLWSFRH